MAGSSAWEYITLRHHLFLIHWRATVWSGTALHSGSDEVIFAKEHDQIPGLNPGAYFFNQTETKQFKRKKESWQR